MVSYGTRRVARRSVLVAAGATAYAALTGVPARAAPALDTAGVVDVVRRRHRARLPIPGFLLDRGRVTPIEPPGAATTTFAFGINNRGQVVGGYDDTLGRAHGFVRDRFGRFTTYDVPGAFSTLVSEINDRGQLVGSYFETEEMFQLGYKRGFLLDGRRLVRIDVPDALSTEVLGIDNVGRLAGETFDAATGRGFIWQRGRFTTIPGPGNTFAGATDINERGQICGSFAESFGASTQGFLLDRGNYTTINPFDAALTQVFGLDIRGRVVGFTAAGIDLADPIGLLGARGFLRDSKGRASRIDVPGAPRTLAYSMNDLGQIVGVYENPDVMLPDLTAADARADGATGATPGRRQTAGVLARLGGRGLGTRQR
jgi:hypothetical protein